MEGLQRLGHKPGLDVGIVGFNNIPDAAQCVPGLTSIDNAPRQLGESAAELLARQPQDRISTSGTTIEALILFLEGARSKNHGLRQAKGTGHAPKKTNDTYTRSILRFRWKILTFLLSQNHDHMPNRD